MIDLFAFPPPLPPAVLRVGQAVHINTHATWLPANIRSLTRTRIGVDYATASFARLTALVAPWVVRPADGVRLRAARELRAGDEVLAADGATLTVAAAWQGRDRWWVISYTTGDRTAVPPAAVLRLVDPTPPVSVHGIPL